MKKFISTLILLSIFGNSTVVNAQEAKPSSITMVEKVMPEAPKSEKDVGAAISPLRKFQASPFTGVLLSPLAAITLITDLKAKDEELRIEIERVKAEAEAKYNYEATIMQNACKTDKDILSARIESNASQVKSLEKLLNEEIESRPDPLVWGLIGLAVGVVSAAATSSVIVAVTQ